MKSIKSLGLSLAVISTLGFVGCGGSGSGSSSGSASDLTFPSNAINAEPTLENGNKTRDATTINLIGRTPGLNSVSNDSKLNTALLSSKIFKRLSKYAEDINIQSYSLNKIVNETEICPLTGTFSYSGSVNEINGASLTYTITNCSDGYENLNGSIYMTIKNIDANANKFKDYTIKFTTDYTITNISDKSMTKISANSYMAINVTKFNWSSKMEDFKLSTTLQATDGTEYYGLQDCVYYFTDNTNVKMYQTKGKVYINNLTSYADYDTNYDMSKTPLVFSGSHGTLISGEARYNMSNNGKVKIVVESYNEAKTYVDANGDGTYELSE